VAAAAIVVAAVVWVDRGEQPTATPSATPAAVAPSSAPTQAASPDPSPPPAPTPEPAGLLQFRGNPEHTFYGRGPLPADPEVAWRFPDRAMCSTTVQGDGSTKPWCGTGWTGQPLVWEHDGITEVIFNSYDGNVYFVDGDTGEQTREPFRTGQMVKGTWTLDPDGFPLLYGGSRDNFYRIVALDREVPTELWRMGPHPNRQWNNDWDGNGSIVDDMLYVGGEDSFFYAVELNRTIDDDGQVSVDPEVLVATPTFNDEYHALTGDRQTSVESSPVVTDDAVYVANSAGRVVGWDRAALTRGEAEVGSQAAARSRGRPADRPRPVQPRRTMDVGDRPALQR
jgi:outer membrane protein assembly factor BamB